MNTLTTIQTATAEKLWLPTLESARRYLDNFKEFIGYLAQWQKDELWRAKAATWNEFLDKIGENVGKSRRQLYDLLRADKIRQQLLKDAQCGGRTKNAGSLAKTIKNTPAKALLALGKAPPEERLQVLETVTKDGEAASTPMVAAATKVRAAKAAKAEIPLDKTGHKVPTPALVYWERRDEVQQWLTQLTQIKVAIEKAHAAGDSLYAHIPNSVINDLEQARFEITKAKLAHVCTSCEGWWDKVGGCSTCHNTGLISDHHYKTCSPKELKDMRERANRTHA